MLKQSQQGNGNESKGRIVGENKPFEARQSKSFCSQCRTMYFRCSSREWIITPTMPITTSTMRLLLPTKSLDTTSSIKTTSSLKSPSKESPTTPAPIRTTLTAECGLRRSATLIMKSFPRASSRETPHIWTHMSTRREWRAQSSSTTANSRLEASFKAPPTMLTITSISLQNVNPRNPSVLKDSSKLGDNSMANQITPIIITTRVFRVSLRNLCLHQIRSFPRGSSTARAQPTATIILPTPSKGANSFVLRVRSYSAQINLKPSLVTGLNILKRIKLTLCLAPLFLKILCCPKETLLATVLMEITIFLE